MLLGLLPSCATATNDCDLLHDGDETSTDDNDITVPIPVDDKNPCRLYLAQSSIPHAGFGLFAGVDFAGGAVVNRPNMVVQLLLDQHDNMLHRPFQLCQGL